MSEFQMFPGAMWQLKAQIIIMRMVFLNCPDEIVDYLTLSVSFHDYLLCCFSVSIYDVLSLEQVGGPSIYDVLMTEQVSIAKSAKIVGRHLFTGPNT